MFRWLNPLLAVYGLVLIVSGIQAYFFPLAGDKVSPISLVAGVGLGGIVLGSLALAQTNPRPARIGAAVVTLLVMGRFVPAFFEKGRFYPAGLLALLSLVVFAALLTGHLMATAARKRGLPDPQEGTVSKLDPHTGLRREDAP